MDFEKNQYGQEMLCFASMGDVSLVDACLKGGVDVNVKTDRGATALVIAAHECHADIVELLINSGADVNVKTEDGSTALLVAAHKTQAGVVELLINSGADVNCCTAEKLNVLHYASKWGWVRIVQSIINKMSDLDAKTVRGETAMMIAAKFGHFHVVKLLIDSGANAICRDNSYCSVLHHAAYKGCIGIVKAILDEGADINAKDSIGRTPLLFNIMVDSDIETVYYLLRQGANSNIVDETGISPFTVFIAKASVGAIRLSIKKGAFITDSDCDKLAKDLLLKESILQRKKCCYQAILNKFNNKDLPALYDAVYPNRLPSINHLKITHNSGIAKEIDRTVAQEIKKKGFCNLKTLQPPVLGMICVTSFLKYVNSQKLDLVIKSMQQISQARFRSEIKRRFSIQQWPTKRLCL